MKLLFDQNISPRMVSLLSDVYTGSSHVRDHNMQEADDETIWEFARRNNLAIVSKDSDFHQRSFLHGFPPKVIWLRKGNCSTKALEKILRTRQGDIERFWNDQKASFLALS